MSVYIMSLLSLPCSHLLSLVCCHPTVLYPVYTLPILHKIHTLAFIWITSAYQFVTVPIGGCLKQRLCASVRSLRGLARKQLEKMCTKAYPYSWQRCRTRTHSFKTCRHGHCRKFAKFTPTRFQPIFSHLLSMALLECFYLNHPELLANHAML